MGDKPFLHERVSELINVFYIDGKIRIAVDGRALPIDIVVSEGTFLDSLFRDGGDGDADSEDASYEAQFEEFTKQLQAWIEHDYDANLLHPSIAYMLLRDLALASDDKASYILNNDLDNRIRDGDPITRIAIIFNFYNILTPEQLNELFSDADSKVREHVLKFCKITPFILETAIRDPDTRMRDALHYAIEETMKSVATFKPGDISDELVEFMIHDDLWFRRLVACYKGLPSGIIAQFAQDPDETIRATIAKHPDLPTSLIVQLAIDESIIVQQAIACRSDLPDETINRLLESDDYLVEYNTTKNLVRDPMLSKALKLAPSDKAIENGLAKNSNLSQDEIIRFASSLDIDTRAILSERPDLPYEIMNNLSVDDQETVRECIAMNRNTPSEILENLARDSSYRVRKNLLFNPNTPVTAYYQLAQDLNQDIQYQAKIYLTYYDSRMQ